MYTSRYRFTNRLTLSLTKYIPLLFCTSNKLGRSSGYLLSNGGQRLLVTDVEVKTSAILNIVYIVASAYSVNIIFILMMIQV